MYNPVTTTVTDKTTTHGLVNQKEHLTTHGLVHHKDHHTTHGLV